MKNCFVSMHEASGSDVAIIAAHVWFMLSMVDGLKPPRMTEALKLPAAATRELPRLRTTV
jgi:hypothetical protein